MVRSYKRKTNKGSYYTKENLQDAVRAVRNGELSEYKAARMYNIPRMTIMDHVTNKRTKSNTLGRCTALSQETERKLASYLHTMERYGFGLSREEVLEIVSHYVAINGISTPFKNGKPGKDWFLSFKYRNNLSIKKPQAVEFARKKAIDPYIIYPYFDLLQKTIEELGLKDKPSAIWNLDETSFSKDPSKTKIVGLKGHAATRMIASPGKDNTTVLLAANANGEKMPPLIIFKGKNVWDSWTSPDAYPNTTYAATKNGWMETEVFENFFKKSFVPALGKQRPVLLLYDGHSTHVGLNIIEEAQKENITILKLPPHTSHVLQPLDVAVMKSFKDRWDPLLVKWQRLNIGVVLPKSEFSRMIGTVWAQIDPGVLRHGFQKAGIYPVNREVVQENQFDILKLKLWKQNKNAAPQINNEYPIRFFDEDLSDKNPNPGSLLSIVLDFINKKMISAGSTENMMLNVTSCINNVPGTSQVSFEELLLNKVKRGETVKIARRKVAPGAEVITHAEVIRQKRLEQIKNRKTNNNTETKNSLPVPSTSSDNVTYLSNISRNDSQARRFAIKKSDDMPKCLQNKTSDGKKIQILSDIIIAKSTASNFENVAIPGTSGMSSCHFGMSSDMPKCLQNKTSDGKKIQILSDIIIAKSTASNFENVAIPGTSGMNAKNAIKLKKSNSLTFNSPKTKGKGVGKKSLGKENKSCTSTTSLKRKKPKCKNVELKKRNVRSSHSSTTSVPGSISCHSDSDLLDAASNEELDQEYEIEKEPEESEINKEVVVDGCTRSGPNTRSPVFMYSSNDYVLVRYDTKTKFAYYVGVIENTILQDEEPYYCIRYFKTVKKPKLIFKTTKLIDRDEVPENLIVNKVQLMQMTSKANAFFLVEENDALVFI